MPPRAAILHAVRVAPLLLLLATARADVILLKNGNEILGELIDESSERLLVRFPGGVLELKRRDVSEVKRQRRGAYLLELGEAQIQRKSYAEAAETFAEVLAEEPGSALAREKLFEARRGRAGELAEQRRLDEALELYRELARESSTDVRRAAEISEEIAAITDERDDAMREEERGRREVASSDPADLATGVWRLEKVYDAFPDRRAALRGVLAQALVRQAEEFFRQSRWDDAALRLEQAMAVEPTCVESVREPFVACKLRQIPVFAERNDFDRVETLAREGLEVAPADPALNFFLGLAHQAQGRDARAAELFAMVLDGQSAPLPAPAAARGAAVDELRRRAEALVSQKEPAVAALRAARIQEVLPGDYRRIDTAHFTVFHRNDLVGREVSFAAEEAYRELFALLGCTVHWRARCTVRIFPTQEEYLAQVELGAWSGAAHRLDSRRGVLSEHLICTYQGQPRLADGLIRHEVAHALLVHELNYPTSVPLWANEGFAVLVEPSYMHRHYDRVCRDAKAREGLLPVKQLLERESYPPREVELFYAQSYSLVRCLVEKQGGVRRFVKFLRDATAPGGTVEAALRKHYRIAAPLGLENHWRAWLAERR